MSDCILNRFPSWLIMLRSCACIKSFYLLCYVWWFLSSPWSWVRLSFTPSPWHSTSWGPFTRRFVKQALNHVLGGLGWLIESTHSWLKWIRSKTVLICTREGPWPDHTRLQIRNECGRAKNANMARMTLASSECWDFDAGTFIPLVTLS